MVGFAAETENVAANAQRKLHDKNLDVVVANDVSGDGSGFDSDSNAVTILVRDNPRSIDVPLRSKLEVANRVLDEVVKLRRRTAGKTS
jgi:phosphopantothenoylcysteine decarboxylase/phosphopantothenate--cysteine ligase